VQWARHVKQWRIRRVYHFAKLGIWDDDALQHVGTGLYCRCVDIVTVADAYRKGQVPCPRCGAKAQRQIDPLSGMEGHGRHNAWFHCPNCSKRLLWRDCRKALQDDPRCFDCHSPLHGSDRLQCANCGKMWDRKAYLRSVKARVRLPCPHCNTIIRKPALEATGTKSQYPPSSQELHCPKCQGIAHHVKGNIVCAECGYERRWRDYRKSLKRRDEKLACGACGHIFKWQSWRKGAGSLATGNPKPAREFADKWPKCRTPQERMLQIDSLLQALHGRGALASLFIEGGEKSIRHMLDELSTQV